MADDAHNKGKTSRSFCFWNWREFEEDFIEFLCSNIVNPLIKERLRYLLTWYNKKSIKNKGHYNRSRGLMSFLPSLITLASVLSFLWDGMPKVIPVFMTVISVMITVINNRMDHYRYYESWVRYRGAAEKIKRECVVFLNKCEPYDKGDNNELERKFATEIEKVVEEELNQWASLRAESHNVYILSKEEFENSVKKNNYSPKGGGKSG